MKNLPKKQKNLKALNAEKAANIALSAMFKPNGDLLNAFESIGINPQLKNGKMGLMDGILAVHAGRALNGDLKSAQWVFDIAGLTLDKKEQKCKIKQLKALLKQGENEIKKEEPFIDAEIIRKEAEQLGIYEKDKE